MLFLQLIGINNVQITGDNTSEAASVEAVLVLDNSESQGYDFASLPAAYSTCNQSNVNDTYACMNGGTLSNGTTVPGCNNEPITDAAHLAAYPGLTRGICQPFLKTKEAAYSFIKRLYEGYDRVAIVNFNMDASRLLPLTGNLTAGGGSAIDTLNNMDVYVSKPYADNGLIACNSSTPVADQWKCGSSNIADGLIQANNVYADTSNPPRQDALWVTLVLVDGAANRAPTPGIHFMVRSDLWCVSGVRAGNSAEVPRCRCEHAA